MTPSKPTWAQLRAAVLYVRAQMRIMYPKRKPHRHPRYRETVLAVAATAAKLSRPL